ncbi:MAG: patatin-like phospholipase family protein [Anaerolineales bacterium]|nr:MAG: patatin-like phospholipase family protein [Anaerolineales bacterium]
MKNRLSIVIGSGGVLCAASLGLSKALRREGLTPGMAVGCSGGSIYAALIALGFDPGEAEQLTLNLFTGDVFDGYTSNLKSALSGESRFTETSSLIDDNVMYERLKIVFGEKTFSDTVFPLYIVATDLYTGERVVVSTGKILDAIRASIAIPMIFSPWKIGERLLVDGAVCDPLPIDVAIQQGSDLIAAVGFEMPTRKRMNSYTAVTTHFNSLYMNNILKSTFAFYNAVHHAEIIPILPDFEKPVGTFDTTQIPFIIAQGEKAAEEHIPYIKRLMEGERP